MGQIVGGFIAPHDPLVFANPRRRDRSGVLAAYAQIQARIMALQATSAVIVGADHYILFGPRCLPQLLIALGELHGPIDQLPGVPDREIAANPALARHIFRTAQDAGFDMAVAKDLGVDHAIGVPAQMCLPTTGAVKAVPIYMASGVSPYIPLARAHRLGELLKHAVETGLAGERVVVLGSGGISHWVGTGEMGRINPEFDGMVLNAFVRGEPRALLDLSDDQILRDGGNGGMEIRHFLTVMGALPGGQGEVIAYEPWDGGVTGLGFAELRPAGAA